MYSRDLLHDWHWIPAEMEFYREVESELDEGQLVVVAKGSADANTCVRCQSPIDPHSVFCDKCYDYLDEQGYFDYEPEY